MTQKYNSSVQLSPLLSASFYFLLFATILLQPIANFFFGLSANIITVSLQAAFLTGALLILVKAKKLRATFLLALIAASLIAFTIANI